jgi:hypothetical protein
MEQQMQQQMEIAEYQCYNFEMETYYKDLRNTLYELLPIIKDTVCCKEKELKMEDWFGHQGINSIVDIVSSELDKLDKDYICELENDICEILHMIKKDRPDVVLKYMKYLNKEESDFVYFDE